MREVPVRSGVSWSELTNGRKIPDHDIARLMAFLGATGDQDLVNTTWYGTKDGVVSDPDTVVERLVLVGVDGAGKALRRLRYDASPEELAENIDSLYLCQGAVQDGSPLKFVVIDIRSAGEDLGSGSDYTLVCRAVDFYSVYQFLGMGGSGGAVWRGTATEDTAPFLALRETDFSFPEGYVNRLVAETVSFLSGEVATQLRSWNVPAKRGVILYGPPGNGKTVLTRFCAKYALEAGMNVVIIEGKRRSRMSFDRNSMGVGDELRRGVSRGPCILIMEDIDLHCQPRSRAETTVRGGAEDQTLAEMLDFLDGVEPTEGYVLLATTNYIDDLDPALRRRGRLDHEIEVLPPSGDQRRHALRRMMSPGPEPIPDVGVVDDLLDGASFADLAETARRYKMRAAGMATVDAAAALADAVEEIARERESLAQQSVAPPAT